MKESATEIWGVPPPFVHSIWMEVGPMLAPAVELAGEMTLEYLLARIMQGDIQLWIVQDKESGALVAAGTTMIVVYPERKSVRILHLGGKELSAWRQHVDWIGTWGLAHGATRIEAFCRPGITKVMHESGFRKKYDLIELDLRRSLQ